MCWKHHPAQCCGLGAEELQFFSDLSRNSSVRLEQKEELKNMTESLSSWRDEGGEGVRTFARLPEPAELSEPSPKGRMKSSDTAPSQGIFTACES